MHASGWEPLLVARLEEERGHTAEAREAYEQAGTAADVRRILRKQAEWEEAAALDELDPESREHPVAASMLTAAYSMLRDETDYQDLGGRYLANRDAERVKRHLLRRLHDLGVEVEVKAA